MCLLKAVCSPLSPLLQSLILNNLNPISIRIQQKCHILHPPISKSLLPVNLQIIESLTRSIEIVNANTDVPEPLWLVIAVVVFERLITLGPVVPRQLQNTLSIGLGVLRGWIRTVVVAEEIKIELGIWVLARPQQLHTHNLLIEKQRAARTLNTNHSVVHAVSLQVRLLDVLSLLNGLLPNDLNPVSVWVKDESNAAHATIGEFLLELVAGILETGAGGLEVVDGDTGVAKAFVWVLVAVVDLVVLVILGAIIVFGIVSR